MPSYIGQMQVAHHTHNHIWRYNYTFGGDNFSIVSIYNLWHFLTLLSLASTFLPALGFESRPLFDLPTSMLPGEPSYAMLYMLPDITGIQSHCAPKHYHLLKEIKAQVQEAATVMVTSCLISTAPQTYDMMVHILSPLPFWLIIKDLLCISHCS